MERPANYHPEPSHTTYRRCANTTDLTQFQSSENQGHDDYRDTREVRDMLHLQAELQHKLDDWQREHKGSAAPAPVADNWQLQTPPGMGLGLW